MGDNKYELSIRPRLYLVPLFILHVYYMYTHIDLSKVNILHNYAQCQV